MAKQKITAVGTFTPPPPPEEPQTAWPEVVKQTRSIAPNVEPDAKGLLRIVDFGFDFPLGGKVTGVLVKIKREATFAADVVLYDAHLCLLHDGKAASDNFHSPAPWPQGESVAEYGAEGNKVGCRLTSEDVNSPTFGVIFGTGYTAPSEGAAVDGAIHEVEITVWCQ